MKTNAQGGHARRDSATSAAKSLSSSGRLSTQAIGVRDPPRPDWKPARCASVASAGNPASVNTKSSRCGSAWAAAARSRSSKWDEEVMHRRVHAAATGGLALRQTTRSRPRRSAPLDPAQGGFAHPSLESGLPRTRRTGVAMTITRTDALQAVGFALATLAATAILVIAGL